MPYWLDKRNRRHHGHHHIGAEATSAAAAPVEGELEQVEIGCCAHCEAPSSHVCGGCGTVEYCSEECQRADWNEHNPLCRALVDEASIGGQLTVHKAGIILHDNSVRGHRLTRKQQRFFGWVAGGRKPYAG